MKSHNLPAIIIQKAPASGLVRAALAISAIALLAGCAATVQRGAEGAPGGATPSASSAIPTQPSMKIPADSGKRMVLNMQLDPKHPKDSGWESFRKEWYDIGKEQATSKGMTFATQEGEPKGTREAGTLVVVRVNDYKHVTVGMRLLLGVMTGNAYVDSKVEFRDLATGELRGERSYNTSSTAMQGIFAPVTPKQIYALVDEVIGEIKRP
jgi:hypothetical protein